MSSPFRIRSSRIDGSWRVEVTELEDGVATVEHVHSHRFPTRKEARELEAKVRSHLEQGLHLNLRFWSSSPLAA